MATYAFSRVHHIGRVPWHEDPHTREWYGNPSISEPVSTFMCSIRRRKTENGETPQSSRAIEPGLLEKLYIHNHKAENSVPGQIASGSWGGGTARALLHVIYTFAFTCLLRSDEVLQTQAHDIRIIDDETIEYTLPERKTDQYGDVKPFVLKMMPPQMAHLCPVRALAEWIKVSQITTGYLFRKIGKHDRIVAENDPLKTRHLKPFSKCFGTICLIYVWIPISMALTHFAEAAVSGSRFICAGHSDRYANGAGGVLSSRT
ncbi:hypothetical protein BDZ89DRAFT_1037064 [Hymenopellis radicata]|nr:hypothetical protein BDZ89DRAFT_1037064 [Hymenopellis radicata]